MPNQESKSKPSDSEQPSDEGLSVQRLVVPLPARRPVPGWRWVKCDDCGSTWKETSRDIASPSHVDCPNHCEHGGDTNVWREEPTDLPRDQSGNLLSPETVILTRGLGHNAYSTETRQGN
jgi:hypothetical protein